MSSAYFIAVPTVFMSHRAVRDPTFEKRIKARQKEKSGSTERTDDGPVQEENLTAPISQREAKRRRKTTSPQKSSSSSERGQGAFP